MLETLLVERVHFAYHRETREDPGYELVAGKQGPKVSRSVLSAEAEQAPGCAPSLKKNALYAKREGDSHCNQLLDGRICWLFGQPYEPNGFWSGRTAGRRNFHR